MEFLIELITITFLSCLLGFAPAMLGKTLDGWMGYNDIFDFIRIKAARKYYTGDFDKDFYEILNGDINENSQRFSDFMWEIANKNKKFMLWMCVDCISTRVFISIFALMILPSLLTEGFVIHDLIINSVIFILGMAVRKYFI